MVSDPRPAELDESMIIDSIEFHPIEIRYVADEGLRVRHMARGGDEIVAEGDAGCCGLALNRLSWKMMIGASSYLRVMKVKVKDAMIGR